MSAMKTVKITGEAENKNIKKKNHHCSRSHLLSTQWGEKVKTIISNSSCKRNTVSIKLMEFYRN